MSIQTNPLALYHKYKEMLKEEIRNRFTEKDYDEFNLSLTCNPTPKVERIYKELLYKLRELDYALQKPSIDFTNIPVCEMSAIIIEGEYDKEGNVKKDSIKTHVEMKACQDDEGIPHVMLDDKYLTIRKDGKMLSYKLEQ